VRGIAEAAPVLGIETITLYAFSSDNWGRPAAEVATLMRLFVRFLRAERARCVEMGVAVSVIGRRDRLPDILRAEIEACESATSGGRKLHLRLAIDYSARHAIWQAVRAGIDSADAVAASPEELARWIRGRAPDGREIPDVDLLVRTGGEQRLSDFMLWECAYAELLFTPCLWPDFGADALAAAVAEFRGRERRFGRLPHAVAG
jgi:undecaprenyl diphosphate synthase